MVSEVITTSNDWSAECRGLEGEVVRADQVPEKNRRLIFAAFRDATNACTSSDDTSTS